MLLKKNYNLYCNGNEQKRIIVQKVIMMNKMEKKKSF